MYKVLLTRLKDYSILKNQNSLLIMSNRKEYIISRHLNLQGLRLCMTSARSVISCFCLCFSLCLSSLCCCWSLLLSSHTVCPEPPFGSLNCNLFFNKKDILVHYLITSCYIYGASCLTIAVSVN